MNRFGLYRIIMALICLFFSHTLVCAKKAVPTCLYIAIAISRTMRTDCDVWARAVGMLTGMARRSFHAETERCVAERSIMLLGLHVPEVLSALAALFEAQPGELKGTVSLLFDTGTIRTRQAQEAEPLYRLYGCPDSAKKLTVFVELSPDYVSDPVWQNIIMVARQGIKMIPAKMRMKAESPDSLCGACQVAQIATDIARAMMVATEQGTDVALGSAVRYSVA